MTGKIDRCVLRIIRLRLTDKRISKAEDVFFYGVAILLLVISMFHIMNSMNFLVLSEGVNSGFSGNRLQTQVTEDDGQGDIIWGVFRNCHIGWICGR